MNNKSRAPEEYKKVKVECEALLKRVAKGIKKCHKPTEEIHYGHVGSMGHVRELLENICEFLNT